MKMSQNNNPMDQLLADMCKHVANLQEKLNVANSAVNKGQCINEKITQMKEYQEKVNSLNSCWRTKNRSQLVSNLQQENRQIIALEEENRQLKFAVKELEDGMHLIMNDYRKVLSGFMRVENLDEAANHIGMAMAARKYMTVTEQKMAEDKTKITELETENQMLRQILHDVPFYQTTAISAAIENNDLKETKGQKTPTKEAITE